MSSTTIIESHSQPEIILSTQLQSVQVPALLDAGEIANLSENIVNVTALANYDATGLATGTTKVVKGKTSAGDGHTRIFRLEALKGRTADGHRIVTAKNNTGKLWVDQNIESFLLDDYGALGNGSANDGPALQAAIDAAFAAGGGTVHVLPATYRIDQVITLKSNVNLVGNGFGSTGFLLNTSLNTNWFDATDASNILISGIKFDANDRIGIGRAIIYGKHTKHFTISHCQLVGWKYGIRFICSETDKFSDILIEKCRIESPGTNQVQYPIQCNATSVGIPGERVDVVGCFVKGNKVPHSLTGGAGTADQITFQRVHGGSIRDNVSADGGEMGITVSRYSRDIVVSGNRVYDNDSGGINIGASWGLFTVSSTAGFAVGEKVFSVGQLASQDGAVGDQVEGTVEHIFSSTVMALTKLNGRFDIGPGNLAGQTSGANATLTRIEYTQDIDVTDNICTNNGIDVNNIVLVTFGMTVLYSDRVLCQGNISTDSRPTGSKTQETGLLIRQTTDIALGVNQFANNEGENITEIGTVVYTNQNNPNVQIMSGGLRLPLPPKDVIGDVVVNAVTYRGLALPGVKQTQIQVDTGYIDPNDTNSGHLATDEIHVMTGGQDGSIAIVQSVAAARLIRIVHNPTIDFGFQLPCGQDIVLDDPDLIMLFVFDFGKMVWKPIYYSTGGVTASKKTVMITGGAINVAGLSEVEVDWTAPETGNIDTITGGRKGQVIKVFPKTGANPIVMEHSGTGVNQVFLFGKTDITLDARNMRLSLRYSDLTSQFVQEG